MDGGSIIDGDELGCGKSESSGIASIGKDVLPVSLFCFGSKTRFMLDVTPRGTVHKSLPSHSELIPKASGIASYKISLNGVGSSHENMATPHMDH